MNFRFLCLFSCLTIILNTSSHATPQEVESDISSGGSLPLRTALHGTHKVDDTTHFTAGAVVGSTLGSLVVHLLDTAVTRKFVGETSTFKEFARLTMRAYVPVLTGIASSYLS